MATINLGAIKFNWKGAYNSSTSYAVDDVVSSGGNSYVCIQAHSNQAVGNATAYWNIMSSAGTNGTNGTDVGTTITTQGDILYRDASGLARLGYGTAGQVLKTGGSGANVSWGDVVGGVKQVKQVQLTSTVGISIGANGTFYDISGLSLNFTPTASNSAVLLFGMFNMATVTSNANRTHMRILRDSTALAVGASPGNRLNGFFHLYQTDGYEPYNGSLVWYDLPNTTNQVTYKCQAASNTSTSTLWINRSHNDDNNSDNARGVCQLIAVEIDSGVL